MARQAARQLVEMPGDIEDDDGGNDGSHQDGEPLLAQDVEIEHDRNPGRYEEEAEVLDKISRDAIYLIDLYHFQLKRERERQHADDA